MWCAFQDIKRRQHAALYTSRNLLILSGGRSATGICPSTDVYDGSLEYKLLASFPCPAVYGHTMVEDGKKNVSMFGGRGTDGSDTADVWVLSYCTEGAPNEWRQVMTQGPHPRPRCLHVAAAFGQRMVVFGGVSGTEALNDLWLFDFCTFACSCLLCVLLCSAPTA